MTYFIISSMCLLLWATTLLFLYLLLLANLYINYCHLAGIVSGCYCHGVLLYTVTCLLAMEDKILLRNAKHLYLIYILHIFTNFN
jgi:hypothetical protein